MRRTKVPAYFGFLSFSMFLLATLLVPMTSTHALRAQNAPASGTSVVVKMVDPVDSNNDPAGKQYRASVTKPVNAGNGVTIAQGAAATITLVSSGSGWTAQISSVTINGQAVAVTSSSASVTSAAQSAANAVNSVGSIFGHHANVPAGVVTAVATGQRVLLPPGTTLSFVLAATAPVNATPAAANATPAVASATSAASAAPGPSAAPASGPGTWYQCRSWGENGTHQTVYVTQFIHTDAAASTIHQAFYDYMHATYPVDKLGHESDYCRTASADAGQRAFQLSTQEKQWATSNPAWEVIHIDWTPGQAAAAHAAAAPVPTSAPSSTGGQWISCSTSGGAGIDTYYTGVFQTTKPVKHSPSGGNLVDQSVLDDFYAYLKQKGYNFKPGSNYGCAVAPTEAAAIAAHHKRAYEGGACSTCGKIVETGWKE